MTIRRSFKSSSRPQRRRQTDKRRRQTDKARKRAETLRGMRVERLEDRRLLAQLVSIQTNDGELLNDGDTLQVSPRDFSFQFNQGAQIDPATLGAIQVTGSGFDDEFDAASIKTDFNTNGQVFVQFTSEVLGLAGNGVNLQITKTDHGDDSGPTLQVADKTISVDLNTNLANPTTAASLLEAMDTDPQVRALVRAEVLSGDDSALIAVTDINYSPLNLFGAKAAFAETNFNVSDALLVNFTALTPGSSENGITLNFTRSDHGGADAPTVVMPDANGSVINIDLNTNLGNETTVQQLLDAIHADVDASKIVDGRMLAGDPATKMALGDLGYSPLVLVGADDVEIEPGAVYVEDGGREVVFRFNGALADDIYRLDVLGSTQPLREIDGTVFNGGQDFTLGFDVDRGAQVVSVVPQPLRRDPATGTLSQARDQVMVYFNDDDLDRDSAEDPSFYQLMFTQDTLENTDDVLFHPTTVEYDAVSDTARLTFAAELDLLIDPATDQPVGGGTYRLRIGTDEVPAPRPLNADITVDAGSSFSTATTVGLSIGVDQAGDAFTEGQTFSVTSDTGSTQVLELDSGYLVQVPQTLLIQVPETGAAAVADTERFIVSNGIISKVFEFDRTGTVNGANVAISLLDTAGEPLSADELADAVIAALNGVTPSLGLSPSNLGEGRIHLGSTAANSLDSTLAPSLTVSGIAGGLEDGDAFVFSDGTNDQTFLFDTDNSDTSTPTTTVIAFDPGQTHEEIAENVATAITDAALGVTPVHFDDGLVHIGGRANHSLDTTGANGNLTQSGTPGAETPGAVAVFFTPSAGFGANQMAAAIATAINSANIGVVANVQDPPLDDSRIALVGATAVDTNGLAGLSSGQLDSWVLSSSIDAQFFPIDLPGGNDDIGHREIRPESHLLGTVSPFAGEAFSPADTTDGISTLAYNFQDEYGVDPQGNVLLNAITDNQKQRGREIFELYGEYLGIDFIETTNLGLTVVTGDMRALDPEIETGPGGVIGLAGGGIAIMDNAENWEDTFGAADVGSGKLSWFDTAMHEIGHLLGLGHSYELAPQTIMGEERILALAQAVEPVFPGDHDIVHGQFLWRPESKDIDLYEFEIADAGLLTVETFAERLVDPSLLDSAITIYQEVRNDLGEVTGHELVARNDDYFSEDAFVEIQLQPGRYFVGVTASGNTSYDPVIEDTGWGGTSQGDYELRLTFRKDADRSIVDTTGQALDGDSNGLAGGVHNFWFRSEAAANTIYVDKSNQPGPFEPAPTGAIDNPLNNIAEALDAAQPGDIVRIVGNGGGDGLLETSADNLSYDVGFSRVGNSPLADGHTLEIPAGVTVMVDEGAVFKLRRARIGAGSSSPTIDRSGAALQVLGTPRLLDAEGAVIRDVSTAIVSGTVFFTSIHDTAIGDDANPDIRPPAPQGGDWGGIEFRNDIDQADASRFLYQDEGIFLNYVNHAQLQYGGGEVIVAGISQVITPLHLTDARPTLSHNMIQYSAHAALSMNPDSSLESNFHAPQDQQILFTSDYSRIGPQINDNQTIENSINGLFIRVVTPAGQDLERLTVSGRWDDTDVTYVVAENLVVEGSPGGPLLEDETPPTVLVKLTGQSGGTLAAGLYDYRLTYVDGAGNESPPSDSTREVEVGLNGEASVLLENLPPAPAGFVGRRLYRSTDNLAGPYELVDEISPDQTSFWDDGTTRGGALEVVANQLRSRFDGRLAIDPGTTVKLQSSRIEVQLGAQLIAEGMDGNEVIFTGISDDRYGAGGSFKTTPVVLAPAPGQWGGLYLAPATRASLDHVVVAYAGGSSKVEGTFADFNAIELHQAEARIAHTLFENNAIGVGGPAPPERIGRGTNDEAVIFVRDAQPVLWNNVIQDNEAPAMSFDVNSLNHRSVRDGGRVTYFRNTAAVDPSTPIDVFGGFAGNQGPLIRDNRLDNNTLNGLLVRGGTLTTEGVWDDTDNVHVVLDEINVPDFHTYGGLRLTSNAAESLVVKLAGATAGFTAMGRPLDIDDRIGGRLQVVGHPRAPVVLTSLTDDSASAGLTPQGAPNSDTDNGPGSLTGGQWRSIRLEEFSGDTNVAPVVEAEASDLESGPDTNSTPNTAQRLGALAPHEKSGDDILRLGFIVSGAVANPGDVDVYSFEAQAGTEVWFDIDSTTHALDAVVELLNADGTIVAQSDNSLDEGNGFASVYANPAEIPLNHVQPLQKSEFLGRDHYSINPRDAGFRAILPGTPGSPNTYHVRVRSSNLAAGDPASNLRDEALVESGLTSGVYQLHLRLRELDQIAGSSVQFADIRYATNGIEVLGQPIHSHLTGEVAESPLGNETFAGAQQLGNLLNTDRAALGVAGNLGDGGLDGTEPDIYQFELTYDSIQQEGSHVATLLDIDYADALGLPNTTISVYRENEDGTIEFVLSAKDSNVAEDQPGPLEGVDLDDLSRGSAGVLDPTLGTVELPVGTYYAVVHSDQVMPAELDQFDVEAAANPLLRLEPVNSVVRIAEDHIDFNGGSTAAAPEVPVLFGADAPTPWHLGDVTLYVAATGGFGSTDVWAVDPFTGEAEYRLNTELNLDRKDIATDVGDIAMRPSVADFDRGALMAFGHNLEVQPGCNISDENSDNYFQISTSDGTLTQLGDTGLETFEFDAENDSDKVSNECDGSDIGDGQHMEALAFTEVNGELWGFAVGGRPDFFPNRPGVDSHRNNLYSFAPGPNNLGDFAPGEAFHELPERESPSRFVGAGTQIVERGTLDAVSGTITGIGFVGGQMFGVSDQGGLYRITGYLGAGAQATLIATIPNSGGFGGARFEGLAVGPPTVEDGFYSQMLFGIDDGGELYAFTTGGVPQPVFVDGQTSVQTGVAFDVRGMDFSTLDQNLWHVEDFRENDPGHGINEPFDNSREAVTGDNALHFGSVLGDTNTNPDDFYDYPGGSHGSIVSNVFSLADYNATDLPTLYFNYFVDTEGQSTAPGSGTLTDFDPMLDAFRVFIGGEDGQWEILATNNSFATTPPDEDPTDDELLDYAPFDVQEAFDTASWRQVRVDLSPYASRKDDLRLRFDFSTAGSMNTGDEDTAGEELIAVDAIQLRDGDSFTIDGGGGFFGFGGGDRFEIELGFTLVVSSGAAIDDGETVEIDGDVFEFIENGARDPLPGNVGVNFNDNQSPQTVAANLEAAINGLSQPPPQEVDLTVVEPNDTIADATNTGLTGGPGEFVNAPIPGLIGDNPILITEVGRDVDMLRLDLETGDRVTVDIDSPDGSGLDSVLRLFDENGLELAFSDDNEAPDEAVGTSDSYIDFVAPVAGTYFVGVSGAGNETYDANDASTAADGSTGEYDIRIIVTNEVTRVNGNRINLPSNNNVLASGPGVEIDGQPGTSGIAVPLNATMNRQEVAGVIRQVLANFYAGGNVQTIKMYDETVRVIGHSVTQIQSASGGTTLGLTTSLPGDEFGAFNVNVRGQNNAHEGIYIDDIVIGLAERGEMVTGQTTLTDFAANPNFSATDIVVGDYQLEIRRSAEYGLPDDGRLLLYRSFDSNDRLAQNFTIEAPFGHEVADGQTFSLSDGIDTLVFEFDDQALPAGHPNAGVTQGHVPVPFASNDFEEKADSDVTMAHTIRDAINGADAQAVLDVTASLSDGRATGTSSNAHHVNIYGNVIAEMGPLTSNLVRYNHLGDVNREREQGQVLIDSNRISYSSGFGVVVDADDARDISALAALAGNLPHAPAVRNLAVPGDAPPSVADRLVPGAVISNNLIYRNVEGGIHFSGDDQQGGDQQPASVPFGRIVNNTLVGVGDENVGNQGTGILVTDFASPTILNNVIADFELGLDVDATSESTVVGYSLFHQNSQNAADGEIGAFAIELDSDSPLFVNQAADNYYLADGAQAIDSSLDSLRDRAAMDTIKEPLGIAPSPILAPGWDVLGQKRIDDPAVDTPFGQGANVFKDRGAIDRADFEGPSVFLVNPRDNDALGTDTDSRDTYIETAEVLNQFAIKFLDGVEPNDPQAGTGVDDGTVGSDQVKLLQAGRRLSDGEDYVFEYDSTSDIIYLNPLAGIWERATNYQIVLTNRDERNITATAGDEVEDGQSFDLIDGGGNTANFEYESGYVLNVPQTFTLSVPLAGASSGGITDGQTFSAGSGGATTTFEFDSNDTTSGTSQVIPFAVGDTATDLANSIVTALDGSGLGFTPRHLGLGVVHMGSQSFHTADTGDSALTLSGQAAGVADGDLLVVDDFTQVVTFEFDSNEAIAEDSGHVPFPFAFDQTHEEIAALLVTALSDAGVALSPIDLGDGTVHVMGLSLSGGAPLHALDASESNLTLTGEPGVRPDLALRIPAVGGAYTTITDGGVFSVGNATRTVNFEFDNDGTATPGNVIVQFTVADPDDEEVIPSSTDDIGEAIEAAIAGEFLGISPLYVGGGVVNLNNSLAGVHTVDADTSGLTQLGEVGVPGAVPIVFTPSAAFSAEMMAEVIADAINDTDLLVDVLATAQDDLVQVYGADAIVGINNDFVSQIQDLAGNSLKPNRLNGETRFTIFMDSAMDFGDAPESYQTTADQDGARHEVITGFSIGEFLDTDVDGVPSAAADGDDLDGDNDEDGIQVTSPFTVAFDGVIDVTAFGIGDLDGYLDAWMDLNGDGDFDDALEQILDSEALVNGQNTITIAMPGGATEVGDKVARFRFSSTGGLGPAGFAADGEVEDYIITLHANPWHNSSIAMDASGDSFVSPIDVLKIVNFLNFNPNPTNSKLPNPPAQNPPAAGRIDVNNDGFASPIDSLMVVNFLNSQGAGGAGEADAGSRISTSATPAVFDVTLWDDSAEATTLNRSLLTGDATDSSLVPTAARRPVEVSFRLPPRGEWTQQLAGRALDPLAVNRLDDALESILEDVASEVSGDAHDEVFAQFRD